MGQVHPTIAEYNKDSEKYLNQSVVVQGWIRSVRKSKAFCFVVVNDGSSHNNMQVIADADIPNYEELTSLLTGSSIGIRGIMVASQGKGQSVELQAKEFWVFSKTDEAYPLQKKEHSLEFLREQAHLRGRTQTFGAIWRIRHALCQATHQFFDQRGFYYINTPIITALDCEGAGEMFKVSTMDFLNIPKDDKKNVDYSKDYFGSDTTLTVSGQLQGEAMALGLGRVYTFGPTFRSENSNTPRHLSEFWMIEPEAAFFDLDDMAELAVDYIKFLVSYALEKCPEDLEFLNFRPKIKGGVLGESVNQKENHLENLKNLVNSKVAKITYTEAVEILSKAERKFEFPTDWGSEIQTEHERYLAEVHFKGPVIVTDYPKTFKAFYMKQNPDGKTVRAMDVLVPGVGEIIGGAQREDDLDKLESMIKEKHMNDKDLWWYKELRKWGGVPHSGFGLGLERAILYITGMNNVRDVIPFPRTPKNAKF